jgi:hypothetical protein
MVPSGSVFTNLVDSVVNAINLEYVAVRTDQEVVYRVNGDDSVAVFSDGISEDVLAEASGELGIIMNPSKQDRSPNSCLFNKSYWGFEYDGEVPSANRSLNSLVHRDSMIEGRNVGPNEEVIRSIQILDRLEYHPWRDEFINRLYQYGMLDDGHSALDYRWRMPKSTASPTVDGVFVDQSRYVQQLDTKFWRKIYE